MSERIHRPVVGSTYQINDGAYKGRSGKLIQIIDGTKRIFAKVQLKDAFGQLTKEIDVIPVSYLEL